MRCSECMKEVSTQDSVCPFCGKEIVRSTPEVYQLKPGTMLNRRYEVVSVLGFGGFGVVYKAWDTNLQRTVAIKEYFPTMYLNRDEGTTTAVVFDPKNEAVFLREKEAFLQEARSMAAFQEHPNIVHVYDFFEDNNTAYFAMEYMDGKSVNDYLKEAKSMGKVLKVSSAVHIVREVLNALKDAHAKGIIHRDIKPQNIYVLKNGTIKLYDFGAARFSDTEEAQTRTIIITPGYAPAEQYQSKSKQGPYTDIYALGAVLYELLTGVRPEESINRKIKDELVPPSHLNSKISESLESIILRAMAVRPEIRFQSAKEFDHALESGKKVRNDAQEARKVKRIRNIFIIVLLTVLIGGLGFSGGMIVKSYLDADLTLTSMTISVWVPYISDSEAETAALYEAVSEEFTGTYPKVQLSFRYIPKENYIDELTVALKAGNGPDAFDSTDLPSEYRKYLADIDEVCEDSNFDVNEYYFYRLDNYLSYFREIGKVPLLLDLPVLYMNSVDSYGEQTEDRNTFIDAISDPDHSGTVPNYIGTVLDYEILQQEIAGKFEIQESIVAGRPGELLNCWSINAGSLWINRNACGRLIHSFLSPNAQQELAINRKLGIPVYNEVYDTFLQENVVFSYLTDQMEQIALVNAVD